MRISKEGEAVTKRSPTKRGSKLAASTISMQTEFPCKAKLNARSMILLTDCIHSTGKHRQAL